MHHLNSGILHFHKNKFFSNRNSLQKNIYVKKYIDKAIYPIGIIGPLSVLPQLFNIWSQKSAHGLSMFTWSTGALLTLFWIIYGIVHKEKPIVISSTLSAFIQTGIVIGISLYQ